MDTQTGILLVTIAAMVGILATILILAARGRQERSAEDDSPFAASSEGMTGCRSCGQATPTTGDTCLYCGADLPGRRGAS